MSLVTNEEFQHILRVLNMDVDGKRKIMFALTSIKGIGHRFSNIDCKKADVDMNKRAGELSVVELENLMTIVANPRQFKIPDLLLNRKKDYKDGRYSQVVSNALDMKRRDDLELEEDQKAESMVTSLSKEAPKNFGTANWGSTTLVGVFAGLMYGGSKEAAASVSKDAEVTLKLGSTPDKREQYRLMRDAMEKRFIRVAHGSMVGGVRLGMFAAAFCGFQNLLAEKRGVHDVYNVAGAGSATAAAFGLILPGTLRWRARNVMMGSILGATVCFPIGWLQLKLMKKANEESLAAYSDSNKGIKGGVGGAIERMEGHLNK